MNLHEFQAKELLTQFGIIIPRGRIASSTSDAVSVARRLGLNRCVVKAQVQAGDRAANGGVRFAETPAEVERIASELIGRTLYTEQTGPAGQLVRWLYIEEAVPFDRSFYCAVVVDRTSGRLLLLTRNRDDVEHHKTNVHELELSDTGVKGDFGGAALSLGIDAGDAKELAQQLSHLAHAAVALDATLVEVSPLVLVRGGGFMALDAKIVLDDNALFRHPNLTALRDISETDHGDPTELAAERHQINYLQLDGDVGVVVNGAGLALATLDLLYQAGGRPANFMDIRTTATSLDIAYAFSLITANPRVRSVLVNVHGGGMQRCDTIADGIGIAVRRSGCRVPIVVRLAGNNAEFAASRLKSYGVPVLQANDMWDAANKAVQVATRKAA